MTLTATAAWVLDNSYGTVPAQSTTAPIRSPKVNNLDGLFVEEATNNLALDPQCTIASSFTGRATGATDYTVAHTGTSSLRCSCPGGQITNSISNQYRPSLVKSGVVYTYSLQMKSLTSGNLGTIQLTFLLSNGTITYASGVGTTNNGTTTLSKGWTLISYTYTTPANAISVQIGCAYSHPNYVSAPAGELFWITEFQMEAKAYATSYCDGSLGSGYSWDASNNMLSNADFEAGLTNWSVSGCTMAVSTNSHSGTKSAAVTFSDQSQAFRQDTPSWSLSNGTYTGSVWVMNPVTGGVPAGANNNLHFDVNTTNEQGVTNSTLYLNPPADGVWHRYVLPGITVNGGNGFGYVRILSSNVVSGTIYVDDVQVEKKSYATPFNATAASAPMTTSSRQQSSIAWAVPALGSTYSVACSFRVTEKSAFYYSTILQNSSIVSLLINFNGVYWQFNGQAALFGPFYSPVLGDIVTTALTFNNAVVNIYVYINGALLGSPVAASATGGQGYASSPSNSYSSDEAAIEQLLYYSAVLTSSEVATLAAGNVDITDDPRIVFAAASKSTAGTTNSKSTLAVAGGAGFTYRGRPASFNTYGPLEIVPLQAETTTPGAAALRTTTDPNSGIGVGDLIAFSQLPTKGIYQVVGVQSAPGQYDELYLSTLVAA